MEHLRYAFSSLRQFNSINSENTSANLFVPIDLQEALQRVALWKDLGEVFEVGQEFGFSVGTIANILILHGAYFRLVTETNVLRAELRFIDALLGSCPVI